MRSRMIQQYSLYVNVMIHSSLIFGVTSNRDFCPGRVQRSQFGSHFFLSLATRNMPSSLTVRLNHRSPSHLMSSRVSQARSTRYVFDDGD